MKTCTRCDENTDVVSEIGSLLVHYVCDACRTGNESWMFRGTPDGIPYTIDEMEYQSPTPEAE